MNMKGGKVIASGGYGCVFRPAIRCKNQPDSEYDPNKITKLMTNKHAKKEFAVIEKFRKLLSKIPNYSDFFLVEDFSICHPEQLTQEDFVDFETKCTALKKDKIDASNVNKSLRKIMALNMPDAGLDMGDFITLDTSPEEFAKLNSSLVQLLNEGIVPMNNLNIYHCDVKEGNIMVKTDMNRIYTRLIDWGLSTEYHPSKDNAVPRSMYKRPFQYNTPFSCILFNKKFQEMYDSFLKDSPDPTYYNIREFVINFIFVWLEKRGDGHIGTINSIMKQLFKKDLPMLDDLMQQRFIEYDFTYYYIVEYISQILHVYTQDGKFKMKDYFANIYIKNIDKWGFLMAYSIIIDKYYNEYDRLTNKQIALYKKIKDILVRFLFERPTELIDIPTLSQELLSLNDIMLGVKHSNKFLSSEQQLLAEYSSSHSNKTGGGGAWTRKYKKSINCKRPKGFSQKQYCKYGRRKTRKLKN